MLSKLHKAIFLQFSGILGAGIFVLPYLYHHTDPLLAYSLLFLLVLVVALANFFYIDVILATKGDHQLSGYAQIHLGIKFKNLATANILLLGIGVLSAYIKIASGFINLLFPATSAYSAFLFLLILLLLHLARLKPTQSLSQIFPALSLFIVIVLYILSFKFPPALHVHNELSPLIFGSTIFALSGFTILPEIEEILRGETFIKLKLRQASLTGLLLVILVYLLFIFAVGRISGDAISPDSITGIFQSSTGIGRLLAFFGIITLLKASLNFLYILKETFFRDLQVRESTSYFLSSLIPFFVLLFAGTSFVAIISLTGSLTVFISVLIISLIRLKLKTSTFTRASIFIVLALLFAGLISELF